jgi:hypothetical protein
MTGMLIPAPIVVDADVLIRNVEYAIRHGKPGALFANASSRYSLTTSVVLFATPRVGGETIRHLPDVAKRTGIALADVRRAWNELFVPHVRFVPLRDDAVEDPRVAAVRGLHANDAPTAALTVLLARAVLATDNRKHFRPFDLPDTKTDSVAIDVAQVGEFGTTMTAGMLLPTVTGLGVYEGSKKVISLLGEEGAALVGLVALGGVMLSWNSERSKGVRSALANAARELGPPIGAAFDKGISAGERVAAFAVDRLEEPDALAVIARRLAVGQTMMTTTEIVRELRTRGYSFGDGTRLEAETRAWLEREPCFYEAFRGTWTLGYHAAELSVD